MRALGKAVAGCLAAATILAVVACGGSDTPTRTRTGTTPAGIAGRTVDIYSSLPLQGPLAPQAAAIVNGIELALAQGHGRAGIWSVHYQSLNDATAGQGPWDPNATGANARQAAEDPKAVYYLGEFSSVASEISLQILNQAKVPQVSPSNTYVGLTTNLPGSSSDEPRRYYPSGVRTYLRLVPIDSVQAAADLMAMKDAGCRKVAMSSSDSYGTAFATLLDSEKARYGVTIVSNTPLESSDSSFRAYAARLKSQRADCFFLAGRASPSAVQLTEAVHAALPKARLFAPDQMCTSAWTNPKLGGVSAGIDPLMECTMPTLNLSSYPGGRQFLAAYKAKYGDANPDPYAIYGYEAMKLGLETIARLGPEGDNKLAVLKALFATRDRHSVLGTYGFDGNGDTTLKSYGVYKVSPSGDPVFYKTLTPTGVPA